MKTIFIVDDSSTSLGIARKALEGRYDVMTMNSGAKLLYALVRKIPDLILLDLTMPEMDGFQVVEILKSNERLKAIPVVFLTAAHDEESESRGFEIGALDFIKKPIVPSVLIKRVETHLETGMLIESLGEKAEAIYYDGLTGIYNRRYLDEALNGLIKSMSSSSSPLSFMLIDVDYFRQYTIAYGHIEGENCLRRVAGLLSKSLTRDTDFVTRYGVSSFAVGLPYTDEKGAGIIAEKLLKNIITAEIPHCKSDVADYVTISIGGTTGTVSHTQKIEDYIKQADKMLSVSKRGGRNIYSCSSFGGIFR